MSDKVEEVKVNTINCPHFAGIKARVKTTKMGRYGGESNSAIYTYYVTTCLDAELKAQCITCDNNERPI